MTEPVQVRALRRDDFAAWKVLWDGYSAFYGREGDTALAHFLYHRSTIQTGSTCYLADLFTLNAARGQGVGKALIHAVYEHAKGLGSPRVYWQTHETNTVAMRLYNNVAERSGFIVYRQAV